MPRVSKTAPRVDNAPLAREIGERLKHFRVAAGLTQQQLADGRYTKAYVSALENGLSRPSMPALNFFAGRLRVSPSRLLNDEPAGWARLEADLALSSGKCVDAVTAYSRLLESATGAEDRAGLLLGLAEAFARCDRPHDAIGAATEAARTFELLGREAERALSEYWLSSAQQSQGNLREARGILQAILARVRGGLAVEPTFQLRLLMASSMVESMAGNHLDALGYLDEIRGRAAELDDRRHATYLYDLAWAYRESGDLEGALRTGFASLELFRRAEADREIGRTENELALSYLALGNCVRAEELAASATIRFERLQNEWWLAHSFDTQAMIALAQGSPTQALTWARKAADYAVRVGNSKGQVDALMSQAHAHAALGDNEEVLASLKEAVELARTSSSPGLKKQALTQLADALATAGDHEQAFALMREAVSAS